MKTVFGRLNIGGDLGPGMAFACSVQTYKIIFGYYDKHHSRHDLVFKIWRNNNTEATLRDFCLWLWITSVLASTEKRGGVRKINYIYAIPCPTGPRYVPRSSGSSLLLFYDISISWLNILNGKRFYFSLAW